MQLTECETGEIAKVLSNKGLIKKKNIILIEYPFKGENQCFSYLSAPKSTWTYSPSSVDIIEFSSFLALYEAICLHLLYLPSVPNIKQALLL